jgi:Protein of unknown function (DUF3486)
MPPVSKVAQFPADVREWLHKAFVQRGFGGIEQITVEVNALLKEAGVGLTVGKSAIGEASKKYRRAQESIAAVTLQMQAVADSAGDSSVKRNESLMALVSTELFEALVDAQQAEATDDPADRIALLNKAALAAARLSNSSVTQQQYRAEVDGRAKAAADAVAKIAKTGGLTKAQQTEIRNSILGIAARAAPQPQPTATGA